jgi:DNA-binding response OmpR family regulator
VLPEIEELATLVVCEDDDPTRELLCDHLTADRYRALPAPSASDALRLCGYSHPDLMVLDLGLPDAGGIDFGGWSPTAWREMTPAELPWLL